MTNYAKICQLKITLNGSRPPIWRRVQVPGDITLAKLHRVIQAVMGWYDSHLHQFIVGKTYYGVPSLDEFSELELKDERKVRLGQVLSNPKQKMVYEYDFGGGWEHDIVLEKVLPPDSNTRYPVCLGGARACPPEDAVGLEAMKTSWKRFAIRITKSTMSISDGSAANSTRKSSTSC